MHVCSFSVLRSCSIVIAVVILTHLMFFVWFLGLSVLSLVVSVPPFLFWLSLISSCSSQCHVIFTLPVSWAFPAIWRPSTRVMILLPTQKLRIICPLYELHFWPAFLKSQELHVDARNLNFYNANICLKIYVTLTPMKNWQKMRADMYSSMHCYVIWKIVNLKISLNLSHIVDFKLTYLKFPSVSFLIMNSSELFWFCADKWIPICKIFWWCRKFSYSNVPKKKTHFLVIGLFITYINLGHRWKEKNKQINKYCILIKWTLSSLCREGGKNLVESSDR